MSKIAYFDCFSGISGDMIIGSLIDAGLDIRELREELDKLGLSDYEIGAVRSVKCGITATRFNVVSRDEVRHRNLADLNAIIDGSKMEEWIKAQAKGIFLRIGEAEARVHDLPISDVHFHEIGAIDTIVDVVGTLIGLKLLGIERVYCSYLNVGSGFVEFSHGRFPIPAPATAEILKGVPIYSTVGDAELVTPTGAAIITSLAEGFGHMPLMRTERIGYGAGARDLDHPNVLRVFIGTPCGQEGVREDAVSIIETNVDDMSPQFFECVMERLFEKGALDVYITNVLMKKNRPAFKLTVLSNPEDKDRIIETVFRETTTIGVRVREERRS
ncbi:MAG TPA: nickel pincer cofactor biosynthesis protein LarC, partial [Thermodesulfobacteriota bacterium]|nr:nickel pincer cofactor biosynthesis protein LarC [Thermodesulfobacteriota bacterium]